jgi:hypothetical protein
MLCFLCGKKIGFLRALFDQQYCSAEHRKEARLAAAQALRDEEEFEPLVVARSRERIGLGRSSPAGQTASVFAFLTVGALLVAALILPGPGGGAGPSPRPETRLDRTARRGFFARASDTIASAIRSRAPVTLRHEFSSGWGEWSTVAVRGAALGDPRDWNASRARISAPKLRLWDKSTLLQNYQMEFQGQIERNSLSWAFRASDAANYYATKVAITKPGPLPNASLIRYVVLNGREWDRVQLPLPLTLERGTDYRVRVTVQDDRFITSLNGQVISSWTDKRLVRGGVGFFADEEDPQELAWVSVSERDSFLGRMLAQFSLFVPPQIP